MSVLSSVLVANRGEIARRISRTARSMGMRCVAVYVEADADAPFVREADEAVLLSDGYLDGAAIVDAARATGSQAIHPGVRVLVREREFRPDGGGKPGFCGLVQAPPQSKPWATRSPRNDAQTKRVCRPLPSSLDLDGADNLGYPILIKAAAGGGGKGMRVVDSPEGLSDAVASAQREAESSFGDGRVFLERYLPEARHIEIQILGDAHGNLLHLGERECSIQRRHQKIIEESPSPAVDDSLRQAMGAAALSLGRAIGYQSAGTVEFLVDEATREFFFLEMNTRLQVEHRVTEMVTGIDLVREQLRVASGQPLGYSQEDIEWSGHAIEARLYRKTRPTTSCPQPAPWRPIASPTRPTCAGTVVSTRARESELSSTPCSPRSSPTGQREARPPVGWLSPSSTPISVA